MELPIPNKVEKLWDSLDIRGCIILSLFLQAFLVFFASFRQRSRNAFLLFFIWSAYLLADWVAAVAIGLITQSQSDNCDEPKGSIEDLYAFWASFLLLHLGGPDAITSFVLEDNELWLRHLFGLIRQLVAAFYSIYLTLPENKIWLPTILVFVVGATKYAERTYALFLASSDHFGAALLPEADPGPDYEEAAATANSSSSITLSIDDVVHEVTISSTETDNSDSSDHEGTSLKDLDDIKLLQLAYRHLESFKGLIFGFFLSPEVRASSKNSFIKKSGDPGSEHHHSIAFRVIEYELSLLYEVLHTKVVVARRGIGCIFRFLSFCFMVTAALLFYSVEKKHDSKLDIGLTYGLLGGSIVLDIVSIFQLISSDWFLSILKERWTRRYLPSIIVKRRRWSGSVNHYNIISYCLDEHPKWLYKLVAYFRVVGILDKIKILLFSSIEKDTEALKMLMFSCFNFRAFMEGEGVFNTEREIDELLGDLSLQVFNLNKLQWNFSALKDFNAKTFLTYHLASEVFFYHKVKSCEPEDDDNRETEQLSDRAVIISLRILSNYLFYILLMKPAMLSTVISDWGVIFQDTCAEAKIFFEKNEILHFSEACEKIRSVTTSEFQTSYTVDGNSLSKSVFSDPCKLANDLLSRGQALLDLLCIWMQYFAIAAINCEPAIHAQQLSTGGELLTLAWLLLNHFGFGTQLSEQIQQPAEGTERLIEALD